MLANAIEFPILWENIKMANLGTAENICCRKTVEQILAMLALVKFTYKLRRSKIDFPHGSAFLRPV
jgi:hypothetical protein